MPRDIRRLSALLLLAGSFAAGNQALAQGAFAEGQPSGTRNLFGQAPVIQNPTGQDIPGMRPETVGAVSYFPLAIGADEWVSSRTGSDRVQNRLAIALPGGKSVTCLLDRSVGPDGLTVLSGNAVGEGIEGRCDLVADDNGQISGDVDIASGRYRVQPTGSGTTHAVAEVLTEVFPSESESPDVPDDGTSNRITSEQMAPPQAACDVKGDGPPKTFGPLRVMFLYTPAVRRDSPDIRKDIQLLMLQLQRAYSAASLGGNFSVSVELAHAEEVDYSESSTDSMGKDLDRLTDPEDAIFKRVHALRDTYKADVVHMLIRKRPDDGCGIGWTTPLPLRASYARWGFSVSDYQCALAQFSAVHEIGHNLGMHHDRAVVKDAKPGPQQFNYGVVNVQQGVRSLMAYPDQCQSQKKNCRRLLILSSPKVAVGGAPFGRPLNEAGAAYNVEVLCRSAPIAAQFR